jgi:hypothetical protein
MVKRRNQHVSFESRIFVHECDSVARPRYLEMRVPGISPNEFADETGFGFRL